MRRLLKSLVHDYFHYNKDIDKGVCNHCNVSKTIIRNTL